MIKKIKILSCVAVLVVLFVGMCAWEGAIAWHTDWDFSFGMMP